MRILISAGEASSDAHAAGFAASIKKGSPDVELVGMGGSACREAGVRTIVDSETAASVMGLSELGRGVFRLIAAYRTLVAECRRNKPDLAVLVDFPDFNFILARALHRLGIKILYFVAPQVWAWRKGRVRTMRKYFAKVAVIFPFEPEFFNNHGVPTEYVGHPFIDEPPPSFDRTQVLSNLSIPPDSKIVALLPGSRKSEIERLLAPMVSGFESIAKNNLNLHALIPVAPTVPIGSIREFTNGHAKIHLVPGGIAEVLAVADAAAVSSGTATVQTALAGVPFFVVYKLAPVSYIVGKLLVRGVENFAMPNLIAGHPVVREYLQNEVNGELIARELTALLADNARRIEAQDGLKLVRQELLKGLDPRRTSYDRVAAIADSLIQGKV